MKKYFLLLIILFSSFTSLFSLVEMNSYNDLGLIEKDGTYGFETYLRKSSFTFYTSTGPFKDYQPNFNTGGYVPYNPNYTKIDFGNGNFLMTDYSIYTEIGFKIKMLIEMQEMKGFYFLGDFLISRNALQMERSADFSWWGSFVPFMGQSHFGYKNKYFTIQLGFINTVSSDAVYNHLGLDDYSGNQFGLRITAMLGRYVDMEMLYSIVRPHQGPWWSGDNTIDAYHPDNIQDKSIYDAYYGKSLYTHKINFRPLPWIRIGIYEEVFFTGENLNPWFANPFFIYIVSQSLQDVVRVKYGSSYNLQAANLMNGIDFNIGFNGWRVYGEFIVDDFNGEYFQFKEGSHPDKFGFVIGGELRGYLITKYYRFDKLTEYILGNMYINFEYALTSKYLYARESNYNYEYVRSEYLNRYDPANPPDAEEVQRVNRVGNFMGFMYGPNSDCIDIAIGWRTDLYNVPEYRAGYQGDIYFQSLKKKRIPDRLFKIQLHFRNYRLGDERNVIMPYYWNDHPLYDMTTGLPKDNPGMSRGTEFLTQVLEIGDILDLSFYGDIVKLSRFVIGMETKFEWKWRTFYPFTDNQFTIFTYKWDYGIIISW